MTNTYQFVLPAEEESHTISNVTTFIGSLRLKVTNPKTGDSIAIKVSAIDRSVLVGSSLTIVKDKPVTMNVHSLALGTIHNFHKHTMHTLFLYPPPPYPHAFFNLRLEGSNTVFERRERSGQRFDFKLPHLAKCRSSMEEYKTYSLHNSMTTVNSLFATSK